MEQLLTRDNSETQGIDREAVAVRAYELWMQRGCPIGSAEIDWYQAEADLAQEVAESKQFISQARAA
jgi:hypothetical protein